MDYKNMKKRYKDFIKEDQRQIKQFYKHYYNFIELYYSRIYGTKKETFKNTECDNR